MNILHRRTLSRRTLLRGAGSMLALPWLEIMAAPGKPAPLRSVFIFVPGGVNHDEWLPKTEGPDYQPGRTLAALAPVRRHVLVLSGLNARHGEVGANGHPLGTGPWLSSAPLNDKDRGGYCTDISVDQLIANQVGQDTRLPSLELGCDSDSRDMHETNISWRGPASPMGKEFNPQSIYNRLFADPKADVYRTSILDTVREDARRLSGQLGGFDKQKLEEYLESVRSIERRIEFAARHQLDAPPEIDLPAGVPSNYLEHAHLLTDLLVLALRTDTTRVSTVMLNNEPGRVSWNEIGVKESHHGLAHLDPRTDEGRDKLQKLQRIDQAYVGIFVRMLQQLASLPEGAGTVLDHCQIVYGSGLTWGRLHNRDDVPVLLAGGGNGMIRGGRHVRYHGEALADLHLAMLRNAGIQIERTADSKAPLKGLA
jgi:hypothetical protein